jgi:hypothetical protein
MAFYTKSAAGIYTELFCSRAFLRGPQFQVGSRAHPSAHRAGNATSLESADVIKDATTLLTFRTNLRGVKIGLASYFLVLALNPEGEDNMLFRNASNFVPKCRASRTRRHGFGTLRFSAISLVRSRQNSRPKSQPAA